MYKNNLHNKIQTFKKSEGYQLIVKNKIVYLNLCFCTSVCMLGTDPVLPLAMAVLELFGLLGPEPGALLQREETRTKKNKNTEKFRLGCFFLQFLSLRNYKIFVLPDISMALFLKVLMTVPSFLRSSGELRLSATFCLSLDRTFRFGSETE